LVAQIEVDKTDKNTPSPQGVFQSEGASKKCVERGRARVGFVAVVDRVRCDKDNNPIEVTEVIRYNRVNVSWIEKWDINKGRGDVEIEFSNSKYSLIVEDAEVVITQ